METEKILHIRKPLQDKEKECVRLAMANPLALDERLLDSLRYVLSFARLTSLESETGKVYDVYPMLTSHRAWVQEIFTHILSSKDPTAGFHQQSQLLIEETLAARRKLLQGSLGRRGL